MSSLGLVATINRPGGNVTGFSPHSFLDEKKLELLGMLLPPNPTVAVLLNARSPTAARQQRSLIEAAASIGHQLRIFTASTAQEIEVAFAAFGQVQPNGILVGADPFFVGQREQIAVLALRHALPVIGSGGHAFTEVGGLMGYGTGLPAAYRQAGVYTGDLEG